MNTPADNFAASAWTEETSRTCAWSSMATVLARAVQGVRRARERAKVAKVSRASVQRIDFFTVDIIQSFPFPNGNRGFFIIFYLQRRFLGGKFNFADYS